MIDRLKHAIDKARETQGPLRGGDRFGGSRTDRRRRLDASNDFVQSLHEIDFDREHLRRSRVVTLEKSDLAYVSFDVLRTRVAKVMRKNGWFRLGITSATKGCGKSVVSSNLALSFARQSDLRTVLFDMDLRTPSVADYLGLSNDYPSSIARFLRGDVDFDEHLLRFRENLILGLSTERVRDSAEICHDELTSETLASVYAALRPDVALFDLPPMLAGDDVLAFLHNVDCVVLVVAAGLTTSEQIEECEQLFGDSGKFLGIVLNKSEGDVFEEYYGSYA